MALCRAVGSIADHMLEASRSSRVCVFSDTKEDLVVRREDQKLLDS